MPCSNLRLLEEAGADLVCFSPLEDNLPNGLAGVYLGGGYPEKYAQQLSDNKPLIASLKAFAEAGGVVYAECGGLIYLSQSIQPLQELPISMGMPALGYVLSVCMYLTACAAGELLHVCISLRGD